MNLTTDDWDKKPGEILFFGSYPQQANGPGRSPIQWRVLQNSDGELFLLSERILDCRRYHRHFTPTSWQDCDLRQWLNGAFYDTAFSAAEKECIRTTLCTGNGTGHPGTQDKVFLLSVEEAQQLTGKADTDPTRARRRAIGTEFARLPKDDGCRLYVYDKSVKDNYAELSGGRIGSSWWWLRTQPDDPARAYFIGTRDSIRSYGRVNLPYYGARPAVKLRLP